MYSFLFHFQLTERFLHFLNPNDKKSFRISAIVNLLTLVFCCLMLSGCDKVSDNLVDQKALDYQITGITAPDTVNYAAQDSVVATSVLISNPGAVQSVWCSVSSLDGSNIIYSQVFLKTIISGTGTNQNVKSFSGNFIMSKNLTNGLYQINYYIENSVWQPPQNLIKAGSKIFRFMNNIFPPVISANVIPDSVAIGSPFVVSVKVTDSRGLNDISQVYFQLYDPNGAKQGQGTQSYFLMYDDGPSGNHGDLIAGDGIYSFSHPFDTGSTKGTWHFEFQAKDKYNGLSNVITKNIMVK